MKLLFKNKMLMAIDSMIKEGVERAGGIPKEIQLGREEVGPFLREIIYLKYEAKKGNLGDRANVADVISVKNKYAENASVFFQLNNPNLSSEEHIEIVRNWSNRNITFFYRYNGQDIPITIPKLKKIDGIKKEGDLWSGINICG